MPDYIEVAKLADIPENGLKRVVAWGEEICLARVGSEVFAVANICSHERASLAAGYLDRYEVECPRHGSKFDVRTGEVKAMPAVRPIATYDVRVTGDTIAIAKRP